MIIRFDEIEKKIRYLKKIKKRIVLCHGVFDLLHYGHIKHLEEAKKQGDILIVSITHDKYIDKNPNDTIPIKYTTVKDVKDTIKKLEILYKTKKYSHKRIWQVGMIMKVRLEAMLKHKAKKYPNAKKVKQRFNLANKYFKFLGKRTKKKDFKSRKSMTFKI